MDSPFLLVLKLLNFLASAAMSLPLIVALGLIIGRRGHAAFCVMGSRKLLGLAIGLALCGFFHIPASYLAIVLPYGAQNGIFSALSQPAGYPWLFAGLCWLLALPPLYAASNILRGMHVRNADDRYDFTYIRLPFLFCAFASGLFFASLILENWPFAGLPEGMEMERAAMAIMRNGLRKFFMSFSPAGAISLLYATHYFQQKSDPANDVRIASFRWFCFWALAGSLPSLLTGWGLFLGAWARSGGFLAHQGIASPVLFMLFFQTLAATLWIWIMFKPNWVGIKSMLAFLFLLLKDMMPILLRS